MSLCYEQSSLALNILWVEKSNPLKLFAVFSAVTLDFIVKVYMLCLLHLHLTTKWQVIFL